MLHFLSRRVFQVKFYSLSVDVIDIEDVQAPGLLLDKIGKI